MPVEFLPSYSKSSEHLKGTDVDLIERVKAEILKVYGKQLAEVGIDAKAIGTEGRRQ